MPPVSGAKKPFKEGVVVAHGRFESNTKLVGETLARVASREDAIADLGVGSQLWQLTYDHVQRERVWRLREILGETRVSWMIGAPGAKPDEYWRVDKIKKAELRTWLIERTHGFALDMEDRECQDWINANVGYKLAQRVERCRDYETAKAIDTLLQAWEAKSK